ncbi:MAG: hypothetical protein V4695_05410 [Pseudomonadota bacterium]
MSTIQVMKSFVVLCTLAVTPTIFAANGHTNHAHDTKGATAHAHKAKPLHGGVVTVVKDVNYELVASPGSLVLYVNDHDEPVDTQKSSATLMMLSRTEKFSVKLIPAGKNTLKADGMFKVAPGTKAIAVVKIDDKAPQSVRFVLK